MSLPKGWNPRRAVESCETVPLKQAVWRGHRRVYDPLDHSGSLLISARYHRAPRGFPGQRTWPALYTALDLAVALGEIQRNVAPDDLDRYCFTEIWVQFDLVLDCRNLAVLGLQLDELLNDVDFTTPQAMAAAAIDLGNEGILVPSATRLGDNLIIFPNQVRGESVLVPVRTIDSMLVKRTPE